MRARVSDADGVRKVAYQWQLKDAAGAWHDIAGATSAQFKLSDALGGHDVRVTASYRDKKHHAESLTKAVFVEDAADPAPPPPPVVNQRGAIAIEASANGPLEGTTLSTRVTDGDGTGTVTYQWQKYINGNFTDIAGATGSTYKIGISDGGSDVQIKAAYVDKHGFAETVTSAVKAVDVNNAGSLTLTSSSDKGFIEGATITAGLKDADGVAAASYQWQVKDGANFTNIAGATGAAHTIGSAEGGRELQVVARFTDQQQHAEQLSSSFMAIDASPAPGPAPSPSPQPPSDSWMLGVNIAGGEFGSAMPGTFGTDYIYPSHASIDYYASKGMDIIRVLSFGNACSTINSGTSIPPSSRGWMMS